jgi:hypothetical protein
MKIIDYLNSLDLEAHRSFNQGYISITDKENHNEVARLEGSELSKFNPTAPKYPNEVIDLIKSKLHGN